MIPLALMFIPGSVLLGAGAPSGNDTADQATSAQRFLPELEGYSRSDADNLSDALVTLGGGASLLSGNPALAAGIATIDRMIQCYQEVGAVAAGIYSRLSLEGLLQGEGAGLGVVAVINQERLSRNFLNCALGGEQTFSAQAELLQPCSGSGSLLVGGETIHYLYAATNPLFCFSVQSHFDSQ